MAQQLPDTARCLHCRYLLRGLPNPVCPECGHPFDPENEDTYYDPARPKPSRILRVVGLVSPKGPHGTADVLWIALLTVVVIWTNGSIGRVFNDEPDIGECCLCPGLSIVQVLLIGVVVDLIWRWRVRRHARRYQDQPTLERFKRGRRRWWAAIVCIVVSLVTYVYPWPVYLRFYASLPGLRREAQDLLAGKGNRFPFRRIGLYEVEIIHGLPKRYVFFQVDHGRFSGKRYGFAYRPNGPPPWADRFGGRPIRWRPLLPHWYLEAW